MFHIIPGYYGNASLYLLTISERASCYIKPWPAAGWQDINKMFWSDSGANTQWKNVFFLGTKFSRHPEGLSFTGLRFSGKYRFPFRKVQIFISQSTDFISQSTDFHFAKYRFHFAKYRFSFRKVQISFRKVQIFISQSTDFISQSTDFHFAKYRFHFAKYRFSFRKVQISFRFVSFRKVPFRKVQ